MGLFFFNFQKLKKKISNFVSKTQWGGLYHELINEVGVVGIWNDMNEPSTFKFPFISSAFYKNLFLIFCFSFFCRGGLLRTLDDETMHVMDEDRDIFENKDVVKAKAPYVAFHRNVHNSYGGSMVRATCNGLIKLKKNTRPFVLTRAGCAGTHRFYSFSLFFLKILFKKLSQN